VSIGTSLAFPESSGVATQPGHSDSGIESCP